jgi:hypothetical protein
MQILRLEPVRAAAFDGQMENTATAQVKPYLYEG